MDAVTINAGTYVVEPDVLELIPAGRAVSVEYEVFPLLVGAGLYARSFAGSWRDIGTPASYLAANLEQMPSGGLIDPSAHVAAGAEVTDSVVGPGCRIEAGARVVGIGASGRRGCGGGQDRAESGRGSIWRTGLVTAIDPSGMADAIAGMADQLRQGERVGAAAGVDVALPGAVVVAAMGGSAMGGELLRALVAGECPVPITRVRGFRIPHWAGPGTLVMCVSYSGETEETLACARQAHRQGAGLLIVGAGGTLVEPGAGVGRRLCAGARRGRHRTAAGGAGIPVRRDGRARSGPAAWHPRGSRRPPPRGWRTSMSAAARELGERLAETIPLIYGAGPIGAVAYRWKTQLNENAKMHAFSHALPELGHNEIVGWEGAPAAPFAAVLLSDPGQGEAVRRSIDATASLVAAEAALVEVVEARGATRGRARLLAGGPRRLGELRGGPGARRRPDARREHRCAQAVEFVAHVRLKQIPDWSGSPRSSPAGAVKRR